MSDATTLPTDAPASTISDLLYRIGADAAATESCQREENRLAVQAPARLGLITGQPARDACGPAAPQYLNQFKPLFDAWITDLSSMGMGVLTERDLTEYDALWIDLEALADQRILVPIRIIYRNRLLANTYRVGTLFL